MRRDILLLACLYLGYVFYRKIYCVVIMCIMGKYTLVALCVLQVNIFLGRYVYYGEIMGKRKGDALVKKSLDALGKKSCGDL